MAEKIDVCKKCGEAVRRTMGHSHGCDIDRERLQENLRKIAHITAKWAASKPTIVAVVAISLAASCNGDSPAVYDIPPS